MASTIPAYKYRTTVDVDCIRGEKIEIDEIFIPSKKIVFNTYEGTVNAFYCEHERATHGEHISIPKALATHLETLIGKFEEFKKYQQDLMDRSVKALFVSNPEK